MSNGPEGFVERLNQERNAGGLKNPLGGGDNGPFVRTPVDDPRNPYARDIAAAKYNFDHEVFVIFRPWESCGRCHYALNTEPPRLVLPDVGDYVCPHTRIQQYRDMLAQRAAGIVVFTSFESTTLKNGVIQVSIGVARPKAKEEVQRQEAEPLRARRY